MAEAVPFYAGNVRPAAYTRPTLKPCSGLAGISQSWTNITTGRKLVKAPPNGVPGKQVISTVVEARPDIALNAKFVERFTKEDAGYKKAVDLLAPSGSRALQTPRGSRQVVAPLSAAPAAYAPFQWTPCQRRQHGIIETKTYMGTYVNTLSLDLQIEGVDWQTLELATYSSPVRQPPRCCLLGEKLMLCTGMVRVSCPWGSKDRESCEGCNAYIARLPEGMRPLQAMQFAALAQDATAKPGQAPELALLLVLPDGWIQGVSQNSRQCVVDLSAIRFSLARGMAIADDVRLHTCELPNGRMALLQGSLAEQNFSFHGQSPLAVLPQACRPASPISFVVTGQRAGSFHLMTVTPATSSTTGADVVWGDGTLDHDIISLNGVMYKCGAEALQHSLEAATWTNNRKKLVVSEFQKLLLKKFGSFEVAWHEAFDRDKIGSINFTKFRAGCRLTGYSGNVSRLWVMLDDHRSGEINLGLLAVDVGELENTALRAPQPALLDKVPA